MPRIIDFHTHAFPDELAKRAIVALHDGIEERACLDGRLSSLLSSMDNAGISASVICCIATHPGQYVLFGTDSPWDDQSQAISRLQQLNLPPERLDLILHKNASDFLSI